VSDKIAGVTEQDEIGVIENAKHQALAAKGTVEVDVAVVEQEELKAAGAQAEAKSAEAGAEAIMKSEAAGLEASAVSSSPERSASAEETVATDLATSGAHPALQVASEGAAILSAAKSDPGSMDDKKIAKQTAGQVTKATTMEDAMDKMKAVGGGVQMSSFKEAFDGAQDVLARAMIGSKFLKEGGVQSGAKAAQETVMSCRQEKALLHSNAPVAQNKYDQAQVALEKKGPEIKQAQQMGMNGPSLTLGTGPKGPSSDISKDIKVGSKGSADDNNIWTT